MNKSTYNRLKNINRSMALGAIALAAIAALLPTVAVATPSEGVLPPPDTMVFATASFVDRTDLRFRINRGLGQELISVNKAEDTVIQKITITPGGTTGWHSHPGPVVVLIESGQMSFYDSEDPTCTARIYSAGQAFVDRGQGHVHIANNEGTENLVIWATYFDVPADGIFRIDAPDPGNCSF